MWKTGGPDISEMAIPKRVRTSRPKYSDTIRFPREWRINMNNTNTIKKTAYDTTELHEELLACATCNVSLMARHKDQLC